MTTRAELERFVNIRALVFVNDDGSIDIESLAYHTALRFGELEKRDGTLKPSQRVIDAVNFVCNIGGGMNVWHEFIADNIRTFTDPRTGAIDVDSLELCAAEHFNELSIINGKFYASAAIRKVVAAVIYDYQKRIES